MRFLTRTPTICSGSYHHVIVQAGGKSIQSNNPEVVFCPSTSGSLYKRQAALLREVTQDLKLSLGIVTCYQDEDCVGSTSISSCIDLYAPPPPSNTTKRFVPQHYDQGDGSGSRSGSGDGSGSGSGSGDGSGSGSGSGFDV